MISQRLDYTFLRNFPKNYKRQVHLKPLSILPDRKFDLETTTKLIKMANDDYGYNECGNTVAGTTWGFNMWPSRGVFKPKPLEQNFLKLLTRLTSHVVRQINRDDINDYSINIHSKLGYPHYTSENKELIVIEKLRKLSRTRTGLNLVLNRNQPDKWEKKRQADCVLGNVDVIDRINIDRNDPESYEYSEDGLYKTMRMRLAFNFIDDTLLTLVVDTPIHSCILRLNDMMHHDLSRINSQHILSPNLNCDEILNYEKLIELSDRYRSIAKSERPKFFLPADCVRFDTQVDKQRQLAYGKGCGNVYSEILNDLLNAPFLLEGTVMGNSLKLKQKEDNFRFRNEIPFEENKSLSYTTWVVNQKWYIKQYEEIQLGSGLSMVAPIAKMIFQTINLIFVRLMQHYNEEEIIKILTGDEKEKYDILNGFIQRIDKLDIITYDEWKQINIFPLSYGDDQLWLGDPVTLKIYYQIVSEFLMLEIQNKTKFLGFEYIKGLGLKLTWNNYLKTTLFPEHDFGSNFRKYPAVSLYFKDLDYIRLSNITAEDLRNFWNKVKNLTGFDKDNFILQNFGKEVEEIKANAIKRKVMLADLFSYNPIFKQYLLTKEEKIAAGLAAAVPYQILEKAFKYLTS